MDVSEEGVVTETKYAMAGLIVFVKKETLKEMGGAKEGGKGGGKMAPRFGLGRNGGGGGGGRTADYRGGEG